MGLIDSPGADVCLMGRLAVAQEAAEQANLPSFATQILPQHVIQGCGRVRTRHGLNAQEQIEGDQGHHDSYVAEGDSRHSTARDPNAVPMTPTTPSASSTDTATGANHSLAGKTHLAPARVFSGNCVANHLVGQAPAHVVVDNQTPFLPVGKLPAHQSSSPARQSSKIDTGTLDSSIPMGPRSRGQPPGRQPTCNNQNSSARSRLPTRNGAGNPHDFRATQQRPGYQSTTNERRGGQAAHSVPTDQWLDSNPASHRGPPQQSQAFKPAQRSPGNNHTDDRLPSRQPPGSYTTPPRQRVRQDMKVYTPPHARQDH